MKRRIKDIANLAQTTVQHPVRVDSLDNETSRRVALSNDFIPPLKKCQLSRQPPALVSLSFSLRDNNSSTRASFDRALMNF